MEVIEGVPGRGANGREPAGGEEHLQREVSVEGISTAVKIVLVLLLFLLFAGLRSRMSKRAARRRDERERARLERVTAERARRR